MHNDLRRGRVAVGLVVVLAAGCAGLRTADLLIIEKRSGPNPWTSLDVERNANHFQFAIVSDRTGGNRPGVFAHAMQQINRLEPQFVMCIGDLIEGGTEDPKSIDRMYAEVDAELSVLKRPFFFVPGNHDVTNPVLIREYERRRGRLYYHFVYRDALFLCLDSEDPTRAHISDEQADYVADVLARNRSVRWTFVFIHNPLWLRDADANNWSKVEALLAGRPYTVFAGHEHTYTQCVRNGRNYYILACTGAGKELRGPDFGEFDEIVWVTMGDDGPMISNIMMDGILPEDQLTDAVYKQIRPLWDSPIVAVEPILLDTASFANAAATITVSNVLETPVKVRIALEPPSGITATLETTCIDVSPHSKQAVRVTLAASPPIALTGPVVLDGSIVLSVKLPDRERPRELRQSFQMRIERL